MIFLSKKMFGRKKASFFIHSVYNIFIQLIVNRNIRRHSFFMRIYLLRSRIFLLLFLHIFLLTAICRLCPCAPFSDFLKSDPMVEIVFLTLNAEQTWGLSFRKDIPAQFAHNLSAKSLPSCFRSCRHTADHRRGFALCRTVRMCDDFPVSSYYIVNSAILPDPVRDHLFRCVQMPQFVNAL